MEFFTPKHPFTHYARFYGIPAYWNEQESMLAGRNVVWDWVILHVCPWVHWIHESLKYLANPLDYEPGDWPIELRGLIEGDATADDESVFNEQNQ